jgi:hypothetical protein
VAYAVEGLKRNITFFESDQSPKKLMALFVDEVYTDLVNGEELANLLILINQSLLAGAGTASKQHEEIRRSVPDCLMLRKGSAAWRIPLG